MKEIVLTLGEAKQVLPTEAVETLLAKVSWAKPGWSEEVLLPTGAKAYSRIVFVPRYGADVEIKISGYAADGSDVEPYDPSIPMLPEFRRALARMVCGETLDDVMDDVKAGVEKQKPKALDITLDDIKSKVRSPQSDDPCDRCGIFEKQQADACLGCPNKRYP